MTQLDVSQVEALRKWAKGSYPLEAATELLIRGFHGQFIRPGNPWIGYDPDPDAYVKWWIDFEVIQENSGALSGGERRFLMIAASIAGHVPVVLGDVISGLDRNNATLVLAALSHANGSHEHSGYRISDDGLSMIRDAPPGSLFPWPAEPER